MITPQNFHENFNQNKHLLSSIEKIEGVKEIKISSTYSGYPMLWIRVYFDELKDAYNQLEDNRDFIEFEMSLRKDKIHCCSERYGHLPLTQYMKKLYPYYALISMSKVCGKFRACNFDNFPKIFNKIETYIQNAIICYSAYMDTYRMEQDKNNC